MLIDNLYHHVLIEPAKKYGADELLIVSGYATANMADRHMKHLLDLNIPLPISLVVGMTKKHGMDKVQHHGFQKLCEGKSFDGKNYGPPFSCHYLIHGNPCHAKVFIWLKDKGPIIAFTGSANYTLTGFGREQIESIVKTDSADAMELYETLLDKSAICSQDNIADILLINEPQIGRDMNKDEDKATLPLVIERTGKTHNSAGLNWGQRPNRDPNQAYIPIPVGVQERDFFPPRRDQFTLLTDDGESFIMVVAQDKGKALHSTESNATIGLYFRNRIGVESGAFITREDLVRYGRIDVDFYRLDSETYYMDFSPNMKAGDDAELWKG